MLFLFDSNHWQEVFQSLRRNRLRTVLTACGVFWGVLMLVVMLGFSKGLENAVTGDFGNWAPNAVFVWGERTTKPYAGHRPGRELELTIDDARAVAAIPGVQLVAPRNWMRGARPVTRKGKAEGANVWGEHPEFRLLENIEIKAGRFLNPADLAEQRKVAVLGSAIKNKLFAPDEEAVGQAVKIGELEFLVVGIHSSPVGGHRADWTNSRIFVPRTTLARVFARGDHIDNMAVLVAPDHSSAEVEREVRAILNRRHRVHPDDPRGVGSFNREKMFRKFRNLFLGISGLTWVVGVLTLLAGAIGVSNIMMIAVAERTKEFGIRKALGATPFSIMAQIVQEAVVLTGLAGYLGLVAGVGVLEAASRIVAALPRDKGPQFFTNPEMDLGRAIAAAVVLTVAGALAGLAPARSAVAVRPVEALAHE